MLWRVSATAWQRDSISRRRWRLWLAAAICSRPIQKWRHCVTSLTFLTLRCVALDGNPALCRAYTGWSSARRSPQLLEQPVAATITPCIHWSYH